MLKFSKLLLDLTLTSQIFISTIWIMINFRILKMMQQKVIFIFIVWYLTMISILMIYVFIIRYIILSYISNRWLVLTILLLDHLLIIISFSNSLFYCWYHLLKLLNFLNARLILLRYFPFLILILFIKLKLTIATSIICSLFFDLPLEIIIEVLYFMILHIIC